MMVKTVAKVVTSFYDQCLIEKASLKKYLLHEVCFLGNLLVINTYLIIFCD